MIVGRRVAGVFKGEDAADESFIPVGSFLHLSSKRAG